MSVFQYTNRVIVIFVFSMFFTACGSSDFTVNSSFSNAKDIQEGTLVYFENQAVGEVIDLQANDARVTVTLKLDKQVVGDIGAKAAVVVNRMKPESPLEIYNRTAPVDDFLQAGQSIKGFDSMFQLGAWMIGDSINLGSATVSEHLESFQGYLRSEEFDEDKQVVRDQFNTAKGAAQDAIRQVEKDLDQAATEFSHSQEIAAEVVEELGEELAPVVKELAANGAELIGQLEKFAEGLAQSGPDGQQAGDEFMTSLIEAIAKLNQAMEDSTENVEGGESGESAESGEGAEKSLKTEN